MTRPDIPQEFKDYARRLLGAERYARFAQALDEIPSVSVRLNPFKAVWSGLSAEGLNGGDGPVLWVSGEGYYLSERPPFTFDPLFHAGAYYVQEAASMFLGQILRRYVTRPVVALDLCAAPGGKSTHIRSCLPEGSLLVSNEPVKARAQVLLENLTKWGHPDVVVTNSYPKDFARLPDFFDLLVTDVPCSGEGMFRKEAVAVTQHCEALVKQCAALGAQILDNAAACLAPGGEMIYSTCTFAPEEDEGQVAAFLQRHPEFTLADVFGNVDYSFGSPGEANRTGGLPLDVTASIFGKADANAKVEDIALGIVHMVLQTIGQGAVFASLNGDIKNIVLIGNLTRLPQCPDIFPRLEEMCDVHFKIPEYAEYRTAIGAALCYIRNREYKDIFCGKC